MNDLTDTRLKELRDDALVILNIPNSYGEQACRLARYVLIHVDDLIINKKTTDQYRRQLRKDAEAVIDQTVIKAGASIRIAQYVLDTVTTPEPTIAEKLRSRADLLDKGDPDGDTPQALRTLADEVERLTAERDTNTETHSDNAVTDPADVKPGEAWIVEVDGEQRTAVKDGHDFTPWTTITPGGWLYPMENEEVKLLHRMVPEPPVITDPDS